MPGVDRDIKSLHRAESEADMWVVTWLLGFSVAQSDPLLNLNVRTTEYFSIIGGRKTAMPVLKSDH